MTPEQRLAELEERLRAFADELDKSVLPPDLADDLEERGFLRGVTVGRAAAASGLRALLGRAAPRLNEYASLDDNPTCENLYSPGDE